MTASEQTPQERLAAKCAAWNAQSRAKPGAKVRVYTVLEDGSIGVEDKEREAVEGL